MNDAENPFAGSRVVFRLRSRRLVWVTGFSYSETYACLLDGWPREETNKRIIEESVAFAAAQGVSVTPVFMIPPHLEAVPHDVMDFYKNSLHPSHPFRPPAPTLPPIRCIAALESDPMRKEFHGSSLKVLWFQKPFFERTLGEMMAEALQDVPWEQKARDFCD